MVFFTTEMCGRMRLAQARNNEEAARKSIANEQVATENDIPGRFANHNSDSLANGPYEINAR